MSWAKAVGGETLPQGRDKDGAVRAMFDAIAPRYELCNRLFTFNLDRRWRRAAVASLGLTGRAKVLDLATGTGDLSRELASAGHVPVGLDFSSNMLASARGIGRLVQGDAAALPFASGAFDAAICGFAMRNFSNLAGVFSELGRVVRDGGRVALLDVHTPPAGPFRLAHAIWFEHAVPLLGGLISDGAAYRYLPRSVEYLPPPTTLVKMLAEAGFVNVSHRLLTGGVAQILTGVSTEGVGDARGG